MVEDESAFTHLYEVEAGKRSRGPLYEVERS